MLSQSQQSISVAERFRACRAATMQFVAPLTPEDMMVQSCPEASPVKWHLAHTSWFFETFVLSEFAPGYRPFHPDFRWLFNSYYKALGDMPEKKLRASFSRPALDQILAFRSHVDNAVCHYLEQAPTEEALRRIVLGIQHEQQHLELAVTDIKNAFFTNPLQPAYREPGATPQGGDSPAGGLQWVSYTPPAPGIVETGVTPDPDEVEAFAFDNETPRHPVYLAPFRMASRLSTAAEFLAFINDDGYSRPELWLSEGWDTVQREGWQAPMYWRRDADAVSGWRIYTMSGWRSLDELADSPVCHVSFFEADAFARWSGLRLPTEFEWEFAASGLPISGNLLEQGALHPTAAAPAQKPEVPQQIFGDVWQWTASPYTGYPGYHALPGALGEYNGKFMSSQMILRGGSCATPETHIRAKYRNFFQPATRWQFSGIRLAQNGA